MVESQDVKIWQSNTVTQEQSWTPRTFHPNKGGIEVGRGVSWDSVHFLTALLQAANYIFQNFEDDDVESLCVLHAMYLDSPVLSTYFVLVLSCIETSVTVNFQ